MCNGRMILLSVTVAVSCVWPATTGSPDYREFRSDVGDTAVEWNQYENALRSDGDRRDCGRGKRPRVAVARSGRPDDARCPSAMDGPWTSTSLETVFEVSATSLAGRWNLRAVGSDWKGAVETFGGSGPLAVVINQPVTGTVATFVGRCRAVDGADSITGVWVLATPIKNTLDYHLAAQSIPDTLRRLNVARSKNDERKSKNKNA